MGGGVTSEFGGSYYWFRTHVLHLSCLNATVAASMAAVLSWPGSCADHTYLTFFAF